MSKLPQRCEAIVLRYIDYGESDRILTLLTREYGRIKGFARAGRNSRKRFGATLEPFTRALFYWRTGKGSLLTLQEAELIDPHFGLRRDLQILTVASYGVELTELLVEEGQEAGLIYELLASFLVFIEQGGDLTTARLLLELRLVYLLGYMPHLLHCSECLLIFRDQAMVFFDATRGGSLCPACAAERGETVSLGTLGSLSRSLKVAHDRFSGFQFGPKTLAEAQRILAQTLPPLWPREPKSLRFLSQL